MSLKHDDYKTEDTFEQEDSLMERLESTIRQFPTTLNNKVVNSIKASSPLVNYLHFFDSELRQQQAYLGQCEPLRDVYSRLYPMLGEETFIGEWFEVDQSCIDQFAQVTGDNQWIHTDPDKAKRESPFKRTISQGFLTLALIPMLTDSIHPKKMPYPEAKMVVNYGLNQVTFPFPVKTGKRIRARTKIIALTPMKRGLEIVREVQVEIENSSRLACVAEPVLRLYF